MKYEYMTRLVANGVNPAELLNRLGADGWKPVSFINISDSSQTRELIMMREIEEDKQPEKSEHTDSPKTQGGWPGILPTGVFEPAKTATVNYGSPPSNSAVRMKLICMNCKTELGDKDEIILAFARRIAAQAELLEKQAAGVAKP